jgi:Domain of unknown function (DUF4388)
MLRGTIDDFSMPDIFRLLSFTKKTGKLLVWRSAGDGKVFFRDGEVYFAQSSLKTEPLGQKLIRSGSLTEGQLRKALDINASTGQRVGEILLDQGAITEDQLIAAVKGQIEDACFDLLRWELGDFDFESHERFTVEIPISVSVENLIMEASRRLDELDMIHRKIPTPEVVLAVAPTPPEGAREINIAPDEWRLLVLIDGQRSVGDIYRMANLDEFTGLRTMYGLLSSGLVDIVSLGPEPAPSPVAHPPAVSDDATAAPPEPPPAPPVDDSVDQDHMVVLGPDEVVGDQTGEPAVPPPPSFEDLSDDEPTFEPDPPANLPAEYTGSDGGTVTLLESASDETAEDEVASADQDPTTVVVEEVPPADAPVGDETLQLDAPVAPEWNAEMDPAPSFDVPVAPEWHEDPAEHSPNGLAADWREDLASSAYDEIAPAEDIEVTAPPEVAEDLLTDLVEEPAVVEADEAPPAPPEPEPQAAPDAPSQKVDRAAVVRELAGLFSDEEQMPRHARPSEDAKEDLPEGYVRRRVEDDDQINKGLIGRFIDGVKGM